MARHASRGHDTRSCTALPHSAGRSPAGAERHSDLPTETQRRQHPASGRLSRGRPPQAVRRRRPHCLVSLRSWADGRRHSPRHAGGVTDATHRSQGEWKPPNDTVRCSECDQGCSALDVAGIAGRSLLACQVLTQGTTILTELPSLWHCDVDPTCSDDRLAASIERRIWRERTDRCSDKSSDLSPSLHVARAGPSELQRGAAGPKAARGDA